MIDDLRLIRSVRIVSSHNHHLSDDLYRNTDLEYIFAHSYVNWITDPRPEISDADAWDRYILANGTRSRFRWLYKAIEALYGLPVTGANMPELDRRIRKAYQNPDWHLQILKNQCRFDCLINERQPDPGSNLGHPELFAPSFRCDCFFSGYVAGKPEPNGFFARSLFDGNPETLEAYIRAMKQAIGRKIAGGCVALKVAIAYERPLTFRTPDYALAAKAYNCPNPTPEALSAFGDAVMYGVAEAAAAYDVPLQIHTGTGQYDRTNPIGLLYLIRENPDTKFHILHGGFPWTDDLFALLLAFNNVYSDICWIPYLSATGAVDYIVKALEITGPDKLTWGCDTWMSEDSYGALLAMEHTMQAVLKRLREDGAVDDAYAAYIVKRIMRENAIRLFKLNL